MVTAELAACLPVLVLVLGAALTAVSVVAAQVRLQDAAREAARAAARGDIVIARRLADRAAPGAHLALSAGNGTTIAVVRATVRPLGTWLPAYTLTQQAVAATEPAASPAPASASPGRSPNRSRGVAL